MLIPSSAPEAAKVVRALRAAHLHDEGREALRDVAVAEMFTHDRSVL